MQLTVPGNPIPKKRPRFSARGKFVKVYSAQSKEEKAVKIVLQSQMKGKPLEGAVEVSISFMMPIPKSTSKKKKMAMLNNKIPHTKKPDIDNLIKFIFDCMNGIVWVDDSQVTILRSLKFYSEEAETEIYVKEL